jgi:hypothetical protein
MTDAQKQALIKKLSAVSNKAFDARYSGDNRKWFVGKIIEFLLAQGVADADIENRTKDIIINSGKALNARIKKGFPAGSLESKWALYDQVTSRTQIIYGMIAMHPQFLDAANADFFDFILERRFRSIQRMNFYVTPNVFAYPDTDAHPPEKMKVNKDAAGPPALWKGFLDNSLPFTLTGDGRSDPVNADEKLFKKNKGSDRNLFACDPVATILHMDALRAAKNADHLMKALAGLGDHYLKIDNPLGHCANDLLGQRLVAVSSAPVTAGDHVDIQVGNAGVILKMLEAQLTPDILRDDNYISFDVPNLKFMIVLGDVKETFFIQAVNPATRMVRAVNLKNGYAAGAKIYVTRQVFPFYDQLPFHFITDSRPDHALFEQLTLKSVDLQVGDHIYVINHPLYKMYYPSGAWGGEHSFITEIGTRDSSAKTFRDTLKVEGHGAAGTLLSMSEEMLLYVNKVLSLIQALSRIHLDNLKTNGRKSATVGTFKVTFITRKEPGPDQKSVDMNVFEYNGKYTYSVMFRGKKLSYAAPGFVIKELASTPDIAFRIFNSDGTDSVVDATHPPPKELLRVDFIGSGPAEQFILSKWAASWFNVQTTRFETLPLFEKDNKTPTRLDFDDLVFSKPFFAADDNGEVYVTRPRVDFSPAYQTFLKNIGAI